MENNKPEKNKSIFKLGSFIKEKILDMYGIDKKKEDNSFQKNVDISELLPHDSTKITPS